MLDIPGSNCSVKQIDTNRYYDLKTTNQFFVCHSPLKRESYMRVIRDIIFQRQHQLMKKC